MTSWQHCDVIVAMTTLDLCCWLVSSTAVLCGHGEGVFNNFCKTCCTGFEWLYNAINGDILVLILLMCYCRSMLMVIVASLVTKLLTS